MKFPHVSIKPIKDQLKLLLGAGSMYISNSARNKHFTKLISDAKSYQDIKQLIENWIRFPQKTFEYEFQRIN